MLLVRMNVDLLMGEDVKKTGAGNQFTVFGEPDLEVRRVGADGGCEVVVELHGVDVYDLTTGEVRSRDVDRIALWMIDTDYNGDSLFVRHCYLTGGMSMPGRVCMGRCRGRSLRRRRGGLRSR